MKKQPSLSRMGFFDKESRQEVFLVEMERALPWRRLREVIEPHCPKCTGTSGGRPALPLDRMLLIYCLKQWYNLSGPGEVDLCHAITMRQFVGIRSGDDVVLDDSSMSSFCRLLARGLATNLAKVCMLFGLANSYRVRYRLNATAREEHA